MELWPPAPPLADDVVRLRPWHDDDVSVISEAHARAWVAATRRGWGEGIAAFAVTAVTAPSSSPR